MKKGKLDPCLTLNPAQIPNGSEIYLNSKTVKVPNENTYKLFYNLGVEKTFPKHNSKTGINKEKRPMNLTT